jgi:hypothetical protein
MFDKLREKAAAQRDEKKQPLDNPSDEAAPVPAYTASASSSSAAPFQTRFASLSLHGTDRLRFMRFPTLAVDACRNTVFDVWKKGFSEERPYADSHEFRLNGYPWQAIHNDAMDACRLISGLLGTLHSLGWVLTLNTDISTNTTDKDTLIFRHQVPSPAPCDWSSVAFGRSDRLRLIDDLSDVYQDLSVKLGPQWIQSYSQKMPGVNEIKLHGYPWAATGKSTMRSRELLLILLETLEERGWTVYASIDQRGTEGETDTVSFACSSSNKNLG